MSVDPNVMMDFSRQINMMEDSLRGKMKFTRPDGKTVEEFHPKLREKTIDSLMLEIKSVLSTNTTFSFYTSEYVQQKGHSLWTRCYYLLLKDMYDGLISKEESDLILESIDHAIMSALMRGLGGMERTEYMKQSSINISNAAQGGGSPGLRI